jgi:hypothetical protein
MRPGIGRIAIGNLSELANNFSELAENLSNLPGKFSEFAEIGRVHAELAKEILR